MSVQKLKLISLIGPAERFDDIAKCCLTSECFQPIRATKLTTGVKNLLPFETGNPYSELLEEIVSVMELAGIPKEQVQITDYDPDIDKQSARVDAFSARLSDITEKIAQTEKEISENEYTIKQLTPLIELDVEFDRLFSMEYVDVRFGKMPLTSYNNMIFFDSDTALSFVPLNRDKEYVWGIALTPASQKATADAVLSSLYFERIYISEKIHHTPRESLEQLKQNNAQLCTALDELKKSRQEMTTLYQSDLVKAYSKYNFLSKCHDLRQYAMRSSSEFYLSGWIPERVLPKFKKYISDDYDVNLIIEDPKEVRFETPPTKIKNPWGVRFFEMFTEMYGLPGYNELDPTPLVALTYTIFFGIMFGDLGQGIVLMLGGILAWKIKKMKLGRIIAVIGASSAVCGLFYGSVFGNEEIIPGFSVLHGSNTLFILLFAAGFGVVLIGVAMILNIINGIRQRDPKKFLFSPNGICGFVFFFGNVAAALLTLLTEIRLYSPIYIVLTTAVPLLMIFLGTPLTKLIQRKEGALKQKWGEYITENIFELFEVMLSFLSNVISYVRIGAFAVSHAGMMLVVTAMASMLGGAGEIVVLIFGNIFVICLEGLIVGIQCLRLQFYEFFSRFYAGNGQPFKPFA